MGDMEYEEIITAAREYIAAMTAEKAALEAENAALREATVRLISRLSGYQADNLTDQSARDWSGHVEPAIATCIAAITKTEGEG